MAWSSCSLLLPGKRNDISDRIVSLGVCSYHLKQRICVINIKQCIYSWKKYSQQCLNQHLRIRDYLLMFKCECRYGRVGSCDIKSMYLLYQTPLPPYLPWALIGLINLSWPTITKFQFLIALYSENNYSRQCQDSLISQWGRGSPN